MEDSLNTLRDKLKLTYFAKNGCSTASIFGG